MRQDKKELLLKEYMAGDSLDTLRMRHKDVPYREIRDLVLKSGKMRPRFPSSVLPDEDEIEREMERFKSKWSEQEAMTRWVGRSAEPQAEERGRSLSRILRD